MSPLPVNKVSSSLTGAELVQRIVAGEQSAFEQLMRRYNRRLYRTARSIIQDDSEAEDVLQEAYLLTYALESN
jgi:RNA polymerase sigma-70 factor, ECF subfamily